MNRPEDEKDNKRITGGDYLQTALEQLRTRPWWGLTCLCVAGLFAVVGVEDLLSRLIGVDLTWASSLGVGLLTIALLLCLVCTLVARFVREEAPDNRPAVRLAGLVLAAGIGCTMLSLLFPAIDAARAAQASGNMTLHQFAGDRGQLRVPGNWQRNEEMSKQTGSLILSDLDKNLHLSVTGVMRVDSVASSFDRFSSSTVAKFKSQLSRPNIVETRHSMTGQFPFNETQINCAVDDTKVRYLMRYIDCGDLWVEARAWGPISAMQENSQLITQILDSIEPVQ